MAQTKLGTTQIPDNIVYTVSGNAEIASGKTYNVNGVPLGTWSTWTPTFASEIGTFTGATITVNSARYVVIGKLATIFVDVTMGALGSGTPSGQILIRSLPVTPATFGIGAGREFAVTGKMAVAYADSTPQIVSSLYDTNTLIVDGYRFMITATFETT